MEKLMSSITRVCGIEQRIYEQGGELTEFTEQELYQAKQELAESVEGVALAYKRRQAELEYLKSSYRHAVDVRKRALQRFKEVLLSATRGSEKPLKTPLASITITERTNHDVIILDFDETIEECKEAVTIHVEDNVKKITLSKKILKAHFLKKEGGVNGYDVKERKVEFPNVRIKGWQSDVAIADGVE